MKVGRPAPKDQNEKQYLRDPFIKYVLENKIPQWSNSQVFTSVKTDLRENTPFKLTSDAVLVTENAMGVVECKLIRNSSFTHGMLEQVLLYCEVIRKMDTPELKKALTEAKPRNTIRNPKIDCAKLQKIKANCVPIIVIDRWGGKFQNTAGITLSLLNAALPKIGRNSIQLYVRSVDTFEMVNDS
jgi:hypothetical protein